jgi:hypothetical protein
VTGEGRLKPELRRKVIAKYWDQLSRLAIYLLPGKSKEEQIWRRGFRTKKGKQVMKELEASLVHAPDEMFEAFMAEIDTVDVIRRSFTTGLKHLPKKRGGRPSEFPLEVRQLAVQDIGREYPNCDSLAEAIEKVASRYRMTPGYLHKVWKNRKRLRGDGGKGT